MMRLFLRYLRERRLVWIMLLCFGIILVSVLSLYRVPAEPIIYTLEMCLLVALVLLVIDLLLYYRSARQREKLLQSIEHSYDELPEPTTLLEDDYQQMLLQLIDRCNELKTSLKTERQDSLDYFATWAHQIKTPIAVMHMMLQGEDTQENRDMALELQRIEQYVEMVLNYSRLSSDSRDLVVSTVSVDTVIRQSIRKFAPQFIRKKLRLVYEGTNLTVISDEKWLGFIIEQLLSNAVKYTQEGEICISVSSDQILSIRDTGIGIAPEDLPRIFEKGYTGYNGRANRKSTGLGLYLCSQAASLLGISISAASTPGVGSTFSVNLAKPDLEIE